MRWLVGWSSATAGPVPGDGGRTLLPVGAQLLWGDADPLWAVGDWRTDEVRVVHADSAHAGGTYGAVSYGSSPSSSSSSSYGSSSSSPYGSAPYGSSNGSGSQGLARLAVLGRCGASDAELRLGLVAARGGALRHVTAWPGSYTAVLQLGRRITVLGDLAGARPVFHTRFSRGTAYATAALPLADLIEAGLDVTHLAAVLACPDAPEALGDGTPYLGVRRVPPGHALTLREGAPEITGYEPTASLAVGHQPATSADADAAIASIRDALVESVRARLAQPRFVPDVGAGGPDDDFGALSPAPGIGADLSGGSASATLALLAAGLPGMPGTIPGAPGSLAGERLLAVTFNDLTAGGLPLRDGELARAGELAADPRLRHVVVPGGEEALPYADLTGGPAVPLTDEPGPSLIVAERHRRRLAAGGADHLIGFGARQVLDAHPARLADLLMDRRRRHLVRPVAALTRASGSAAAGPSVLVPFTVPITVYRAARRLARTPYQQGVEDAAARLLRYASGSAAAGAGSAFDGPIGASLAAMAWVRPGPAARWLTGEALAEVSVRLQDAARRPWPIERPGERRARAALARHAADFRVLEQAAAVPSQRLHAPYLDNAVVRAARALPGALRVRPGARADILRDVLASAGVRSLPAGWGAASHSSAAAAAARAGVRSAVDPLVELFEAPLLADAGLVDARVVRDALRSAATTPGAPLDGLGELVAVELWLRRLLARRGSCWTGTESPGRRAVASGVQRLSL
ncbi:asparagine synthase [Actinacidiphila bryophytorum]|uniref:Asparagine synthase (Glutamine-hydrolyzing) n=1 Tax=Actinacidiphila bryophytorum TaxID=1436133 RepID=A0A9W4H1D9_9ACTN|nr:asparagine synthase [Actinacidiphila bryophytorum]MBM9434967.1 asparagine synthase [Actinacidiphila bryophytorum]MBN6544987.1 asparagine synthase [Actinacidiphila bryophytorum]CAG7641867.1 putative Asparagine synthase (glutamine-hydrolyzing) [Actinacidiphila bryophytorum]